MQEISHIRHNRLIFLFLFSFIVFLGTPLFFKLSASTKDSNRNLAGSGYGVSIRTTHLSDASLQEHGSEVSATIGIARDREHFYSLRSFPDDRYRGLAQDDGIRPIVQFSDTGITDNLFALHAGLKESLSSFVASHQRACLLSVNGTAVTALLTEQSIDHVLADLVRHYTPKAGGEEKIESLEVSIKDHIEKRFALVAKSQVLFPEKALALLLKGTTQEKHYTVVGGDTVWEIAKRFRMSVEDIERANPNIDIERIYVGDILNLIVPKPLLRVETRYVYTSTQLIPHTTVVHWDNTLYRTQSILEQSGVFGKKRVTTRVTLSNGTPSSTEVLNEEITHQPITRVMRKGTRRTADDELTVAFLPADLGIITSFYGMRWGRLHRGIDVGVPPGTPVYAIRSGRVLSSGFRRRLGKFVHIKHAGGLESLYGHNSDLLVTGGDTVRKGQMIARSGNSGYSTGPHVHFEVHDREKLLDPVFFLRTESVGSEDW